MSSAGWGAKLDMAGEQKRWGDDEGDAAAEDLETLRKRVYGSLGMSLGTRFLQEKDHERRGAPMSRCSVSSGFSMNPSRTLPRGFDGTAP